MFPSHDVIAPNPLVMLGGCTYLAALGIAASVVMAAAAWLGAPGMLVVLSPGIAWVAGCEITDRVMR